MLRYAAYLTNLEQLLASGKLPATTTIVMLEGRNGQAFAVKAPSCVVAPTSPPGMPCIGV
eukprot:5324948-Amphidinium_carterae.1